VTSPRPHRFKYTIEAPGFTPIVADVDAPGDVRVRAVLARIGSGTTGTASANPLPGALAGCEPGARRR
jgi:hypothetical protein